MSRRSGHSLHRTASNARFTATQRSLILSYRNDHSLNRTTAISYLTTSQPLSTVPHLIKTTPPSSAPRRPPTVPSHSDALLYYTATTLYSTARQPSINLPHRKQQSIYRTSTNSYFDSSNHASTYRTTTILALPHPNHPSHHRTANISQSAQGAVHLTDAHSLYKSISFWLSDLSPISENLFLGYRNRTSLEGSCAAQNEIFHHIDKMSTHDYQSSYSSQKTALERFHIRLIYHGLKVFHFRFLISSKDISSRSLSSCSIYRGQT